MPKAICLRNMGKVTEFEYDSKINLSKDTIDYSKYFPKSIRRTIGKGELKKKHDFEYESKKISFYAWDDGDAGEENKHEMPPPIDKELWFGNSYMIAHINNSPVDFSESDFRNFMMKEFQGFDDLGSEDSWSVEESLADDDSLNDFIVNDDCY